MSKMKLIITLLALAMTTLTVASCGKELKKKDNSSESEAVSDSTADSSIESTNEPTIVTDSKSDSKSTDDNNTDNDSSAAGTGIVIEDFINLDELDDENVVIIGGGNSTANKDTANNSGQTGSKQDTNTDASSVPPNLEQGWGELL